VKALSHRHDGNIVSVRSPREFDVTSSMATSPLSSLLSTLQGATAKVVTPREANRSAPLEPVSCRNCSQRIGSNDGDHGNPGY